MRVLLTKSDANACPTFAERGRLANDTEAKLLLSIHVDAPNPLALLDAIPYRNGSLALYHPKKPESKRLADRAAQDVSSYLGLNNRGSATRADLAMLSPQVVQAPAVILEVARLSGRDERVLHASGARAATAAGIKSTVQYFLATLP